MNLALPTSTRQWTDNINTSDSHLAKALHARCGSTDLIQFFNASAGGGYICSIHRCSAQSLCHWSDVGAECRARTLRCTELRALIRAIGFRRARARSCRGTCRSTTISTCVVGGQTMARTFAVWKCASSGLQSKGFR